MNKSHETCAPSGHAHEHSYTLFYMYCYNQGVRAEFITFNHADEYDLGWPWHTVTSAPLSSLALHL